MLLRNLGLNCILAIDDKMGYKCTNRDIFGFFLSQDSAGTTEIFCCILVTLHYV